MAELCTKFEGPFILGGKYSPAAETLLCSSEHFPSTTFSTNFNDNTDAMYITRESYKNRAFVGTHAERSQEKIPRRMPSRAASVFSLVLSLSLSLSLSRQ